MKGGRLKSGDYGDIGDVVTDLYRLVIYQNTQYLPYQKFEVRLDTVHSHVLTASHPVTEVLSFGLGDFVAAMPPGPTGRPWPKYPISSVRKFEVRPDTVHRVLLRHTPEMGLRLAISN